MIDHTQRSPPIIQSRMSLKMTLKSVTPVSCERCHEDFKTSLHLKYHKFRVHNKGWPYVCKRCKKAFRRINELQQHCRRHRRRHSSAYVCSVCDECFKTRGQLKTHQGNHTHFEGDHECGYCSATFLHLAEARLHVLIAHNDLSVLPQGKPIRRRPPGHCQDDSVLDAGDEIFSVKEGEGLKIKLKRKLSTDGPYEHQTEDLNPGSHASDSGKGNSDMDEEDLLRNGNQLLKMPTLVFRHNEHTITTTQHKLSHDSSLLMKPKLELEQTQWGGSKIQPRLDSSDFLSKTNFGSSFNNKLSGSFGSTLTPPRASFGSPTHPGTFSTGMLNGTGSGFNLLNSADVKPPMFQQANFLSSSSLSNSTATLFNSKPTLLSKPSSGFGSTGVSFGTKPMTSSFLSNGPINGSVFKTPPAFPSSLMKTKFGQSTGFGSNAQSATFGGGSSMSNFGQSSQSNFMVPPSKVGFGASTFGMSAPMSGLGSFSASSVKQARTRNGEISHEPVFGSREKVRSMIATKEEKEKHTGAFEQYAGSTGETTSNPFADAMKKAKNPSPRRHSDSDLFDESSSYYSESEEDEEEEGESGDISGFTDDEAKSVSLGEEELPEQNAVSHLATLPEEPYSVPAAAAFTPQQSWASPQQILKSPLKQSPVKSLASPRLNHVTNEITAAKVQSPWHQEMPEEQISSPARKLRRGSKSSRTPSVPSSPAPVPSHKALPSPAQTKQASKLEEAVEESLAPPAPRSRRRGSRCSPTKTPIISSEPKQSSKTPNHAPFATPQQNGDIGAERKPLNEVSGHIDLEMPSMSLSIPLVLLNKATPDTKKTKSRRPSGRPRRTSMRTPNPYAATPSYTPPTPAYQSQTPILPPATPLYSSHTPAQTPAYIPAPPTPSYHPVPATPQHAVPATPHHAVLATPNHAVPATPHHAVPATPNHAVPASPHHVVPATPNHAVPATPHHAVPPTPQYSAPTPSYPPRTPSHVPASLQNSAPSKYNPKLHAPTKQEMMERFRKNSAPPVRKTKARRIGPKSYMRRRGKLRSDSENEAPRDDSLFYKSELLPSLLSRADLNAPYQARFKQNQIYLCYLRRRALDLIITLFPDIRCGGEFCAETDDVDGLVEYLITTLQNQDSSSRCMGSIASEREHLQVNLCPASKRTIRALQNKLCKLLKIMLPSLSLQMIETEGIHTLPKLIHKVITENNVT